MEDPRGGPSMRPAGPELGGPNGARAGALLPPMRVSIPAPVQFGISSEKHPRGMGYVLQVGSLVMLCLNAAESAC